MKNEDHKVTQNFYGPGENVTPGDLTTGKPPELTLRLVLMGLQPTLQQDLSVPVEEKQRWLAQLDEVLRNPALDSVALQEAWPILPPHIQEAVRRIGQEFFTKL